MNYCFSRQFFGLTIVAGFLAGCANSGNLVDAPTVSLTSVELAEFDLKRQIFHLGFDVDNPNPFPLPVKAVEYSLIFDDKKFAGGAMEGKFTVPAGGQDAFVISVEIDTLNTVSQISSLLRGGMPDQVHYELHGSLTVDIPFARPLPFSSSGIVNVRGSRF